MKYLFILPILFLCSCTSLDKDFVNSTDKAWKVIGPNYTSLVRNSPDILPEKKDALLKHAEEFSAMIEDAKKLVGLSEENKEVGPTARTYNPNDPLRAMKR